MKSCFINWNLFLQVPPLFLNVQPDHHILDSMSLFNSSLLSYISCASHTNRLCQWVFFHFDWMTKYSNSIASHVSAYLVQCVLLQALKLFSYLRWFTNQKNQGYFQEHWYVSPSVSCGTKTIALALITLDDFWSHISC